MANTIKIKRGSGSDPGASDLVVGELAVRTDTGKLFTKKDDNSITQLSGGGIDDGDKGDITISGSGSSFTIDNGVISTAKIADDAVNSDKLASGLLLSAGTNKNIRFSGGIGEIGSVTGFQAVNDAESANTDFGIRATTIRLATGSAERLRVKDAGIDVTGVITGTASVTGLVLTRNSQTISLDGNYGNGGDQAVLASASLRFYANGTEEKMRILANGNVGIANTSPSEKLDVTGNIKLKNTLTLEEASGSESYQLSVNSFGGLDINNDTTKIAEFTDANTLNLLDDVKLTCGTDSDLKIYHNGSNSYIEESGTGILGIQSSEVQIGNAASNKIGAKFVQNAQVELYHDNTKKLHTDSFGIIVSGGLALDGDNLELRIGNGQDLKVYHDGNHTYIDNHTGQLKIRNAAAGDIRIEPRDAEAAIVAKVDDAVELYFDNSKKFQTKSTGGQITGQLQFADGGSSSGDNMVSFGSSDDLKIFHTGTNGKIIESTGNAFQIQGDDLRLQSTGGEHYFIGNANGAVALYHNNSHKISTATYGAVVRGDGSSTDGTIQLNCSQNSHGIKIKSPAHSAGASYTFTFPTDIQSGKFLTVDSSGNTSWGTPTNTNTQLSNEQVQDIVGAMVSSNTESGITVTYQDGDGTLDFSVASQTDQNFTTTLKNKLDGIAAGATNVTNNNQLTNGAGYITSAALSGAADGGDAASLDGIDSTQFVRSDASDTMSGDYTFSSSSQDVINLSANSTNDNRGIAFNSRTALSADYNDGFLRLNNAQEFSNGVFTPLVMRADGGFNVDGTTVINGSAQLIASRLTGALPAIDGSALTGISAGLATTGGTLTGTLNSRAIIPTANNSYDLGSTSKRWRNVYTSDLQMSNEGSQNDVDMTWGSYTIQEGHHDLFLINKRTGKKYKFLLKEVG